MTSLLESARRVIALHFSDEPYPKGLMHEFMSDLREKVREGFAEQSRLRAERDRYREALKTSVKQYIAWNCQAHENHESDCKDCRTISTEMNCIFCDGWWQLADQRAGEIKDLQKTIRLALKSGDTKAALEHALAGKEPPNG